MKAFLISLALLTGCAGAPRLPDLPKEVKVQVAVGCLGEQPVMPVDTFSVGAWPGEKAAAQAALVDREAWKLYATKLLAAQAGCDRKPAGSAAAVSIRQPISPLH